MKNIVVCLDYYLKKIGITDECWLNGQKQDATEKRKIIYLCLMYNGYKIADIQRLARKKQGATIMFALYTCVESIMLGDEVLVRYAISALDNIEEVKKACEVVRQHYLKDCINMNRNIEKWSVLCNGKYFGKQFGENMAKKNPISKQLLLDFNTLEKPKAKTVVKTKSELHANSIRIYTNTHTSRIVFSKEIEAEIAKNGYNYAMFKAFPDIKICAIVLNKIAGAKLIDCNRQYCFNSVDAVDSLFRLSGKTRNEVGSVFDFQFYTDNSENKEKKMTLFVIPTFLKLSPNFRG